MRKVFWVIHKSISHSQKTQPSDTQQTWYSSGLQRIETYGSEYGGVQTTSQSCTCIIRMCFCTYTNWVYFLSHPWYLDHTMGSRQWMVRTTELGVIGYIHQEDLSLVVLGMFPRPVRGLLKISKALLYNCQEGLEAGILALLPDETPNSWKACGHSPLPNLRPHHSKMVVFVLQDLFIWFKTMVKLWSRMATSGLKAHRLPPAVPVFFLPTEKDGLKVFPTWPKTSWNWLGPTLC